MVILHSRTGTSNNDVTLYTCSSTNRVAVIFERRTAPNGDAGYHELECNDSTTRIVLLVLIGFGGSGFLLSEVAMSVC